MFKVSEIMKSFSNNIEINRFVMSDVILNSSVRRLSLEEFIVDNPRGFMCDGLSIFVPFGAIKDNLNSIKVSITSDIKDSQVIFGQMPQGRLHLSMHGRAHRVAIFTKKRIQIDARLFDNSCLVVGEDVFCAGMRAVLSQSSIYIGSDCLFSDEILIQAGDQHGIFNVETRKHEDPKRHIDIGRHVWVGRRATICNRAAVGDGSIIGTGAVVAGKVPSLCAVVGNPAKVIRKGISWSENGGSVSSHEIKMIDDILLKKISESP